MKPPILIGTEVVFRPCPDSHPFRSETRSSAWRDPRDWRWYVLLRGSLVPAPLDSMEVVT